ncbi:mediator of RNA polymerase II transcription subunit 30 isoform X2 [Cloeon dipterum]|uniref:mediator of RNA polymerase II transcription subunit 30 isoform X2 n=1 Tax=Cloeon dipterum TaxID=197152 RepID=UPI0032202FDA
MAGPQNMYPGGGGGYPNPQQQGGMRQPFPGAAGNVGMMSPAQQQGMMGQQGYGQMGAQMGNQMAGQMGNQMGGQIPGQLPNQMQQMQQQMGMQPQMQPGMPMQQQQAMQQQMQQMQMGPQGMPGGVIGPQQMQQQQPQQPMQPMQGVQQPQQPPQQQQGVTTPQQTPPQAPTPAQQGQPKDVNTAMLCRLGQETVHDILSRTQDVFSSLKSVSLPNGTLQGQTATNEKRVKVQEQLKALKVLFKRLRLIYEKCNENCQGMEYTHIESLIPLKDEWDMKSEEKKTSEMYKQSCEEQNEVMERSSWDHQ